ncbi:MAG TPA: hypothetical protein DD640_05190 [Clostridiales bacterium]|nr:hypothetical protein [Clostridiales bacterium]
MARIAVVGAGKTGRGFIGRLLQEDSRDILFIDKNQKLVDALNTKQSYTIRFFGASRDPAVVDRYTARTWDTVDLAGVDLIFVAVCSPNLADVGRQLGQRLDTHRTCRIITCENAVRPAQILAEAIGLPQVFVSEAAVFCTTVEGGKEDGELDIVSENYPDLPCNAAQLAGYRPNIRGVTPMDHFAGFLTRKLFTYNAASCVIAYLGWLRGYDQYGDAANDPEILALLDRNYAATNRALCAEFDYDPEEQAAFAALSRAKFRDRTIADTIARNAREPQRKLGRNERIIGPLLLIAKHHGDVSVLVMTAAAMLLYDAAGETEWQRIKQEKTRGQILTDLCGLTPGDELYQAILDKANELG